MYLRSPCAWHFGSRRKTTKWELTLWKKKNSIKVALHLKLSMYSFYGLISLDWIKFMLRFISTMGTFVLKLEKKNWRFFCIHYYSARGLIVPNRIALGVKTKKIKHYPAAHAILHKQLWPVGMKHSLSKTSFHFQKKNKPKKALSQIIK